MILPTSDPTFTWKKSQIDALNKWHQDTTDTLTVMRAMIELMHDKVFGTSFHDSSADCPLCRDRGYFKLKQAGTYEKRAESDTADKQAK